MRSSARPFSTAKVSWACEFGDLWSSGTAPERLRARVEAARTERSSLRSSASVRAADKLHPRVMQIGARNTHLPEQLDGARRRRGSGDSASITEKARRSSRQTPLPDVADGRASGDDRVGKWCRACRAARRRGGRSRPCWRAHSHLDECGERRVEQPCAWRWFAHDCCGGSPQAPSLVVVHGSSLGLRSLGRSFLELARRGALRKHASHHREEFVVATACTNSAAP